MNITVDIDAKYNDKSIISSLVELSDKQSSVQYLVSLYMKQLAIVNIKSEQLMISSIVTNLKYSEENLSSSGVYSPIKYLSKKDISTSYL